jgi:hypothetical protein
MLFREIIAVYCEYRIKHINTVFGNSAEAFNAKTRCTYNALQASGKKNLISFFRALFFRF